MGLRRGLVAAAHLGAFTLLAWALCMVHATKKGPKVPQEMDCRALQDRLRSAMFQIRNRYGADTVRRSVSVIGSEDRYAVLLQRLMAGEPVQVASVGGSISNFSPGYGQFLADWLQEVFPTKVGQGMHRSVVASEPGAGSFLHAFCLPMLFNRRRSISKYMRWENVQKSDIFIVEVALNDFVLEQPDMRPPKNGQPSFYQDALLHTLLTLPSRPLVVLLNFGTLLGQDVKLWGAQTPYRNSVDQQLRALASLYGIPTVSVWHAYFPLVQIQGLEGCKDPSEWPEKMKQVSASIQEMQMNHSVMFLDRAHPSAEGRRMAGSLVAHLLFKQTLDLLKNSRDQDLTGETVVSSPLPSILNQLFPTLCMHDIECEECTRGQGASALLPSPMLWGSAVLMMPPQSFEGELQDVCLGVKDMRLLNVRLGLIEPSESAKVLRWMEEVEGGVERVIPIVGFASDFAAKTSSGWVRDRCFFGDMLCWIATRPNAHFEVKVDFRKVDSDCRQMKTMGIVYRMSAEKKHKEAGIDVYFNGEQKWYVPAVVQGNHFRHWNTFLFSNVEDMCQPFLLGFTSRTDWFKIYAFIAA